MTQRDWESLLHGAVSGHRFERVQAPPVPRRIAALRICGLCARPIRKVCDRDRVVWVDDSKPFPGGPLVIVGDRVVFHRQDGGVGFRRHVCPPREGVR